MCISTNRILKVIYSNNKRAPRRLYYLYDGCVYVPSFTSGQQQTTSYSLSTPDRLPNLIATLRDIGYAEDKEQFSYTLRHQLIRIYSVFGCFGH